MRYLLKITTIILLGMCYQVNAQPMVSYYLESGEEHSRGRPFRIIEEAHEVQISGVSSSPQMVVKEFNQHGYILSQVTRSPAGGITNETKWEYLDGKKLTYKHHRYFVNIIGWREDEVRIHYDEETLMPNAIDVIKDGDLFQHASVRVDTNSRISTVRVYLANGSHIFTERLRYFDESNIVRVFVYKPNEQFYGTWAYPIEPTEKFVFETVNRKYYPTGNIKIERLPDPSKVEQAYLYEYEYDSQGNWVEKETYQVEFGRRDRIKNKKLEHRITRKITYY